jgi:hypothetical protein
MNSSFIICLMLALSGLRIYLNNHLVYSDPSQGLPGVDRGTSAAIDPSLTYAAYTVYGPDRDKGDVTATGLEVVRLEDGSPTAVPWNVGASADVAVLHVQINARGDIAWRSDWSMSADMEDDFLLANQYIYSSARGVVEVTQLAKDVCDAQPYPYSASLASNGDLFLVMAPLPSQEPSSQNAVFRYNAAENSVEKVWTPPADKSVQDAFCGEADASLYFLVRGELDDPLELYSAPMLAGRDRNLSPEFVARVPKYLFTNDGTPLLQDANGALLDLDGREIYNGLVAGESVLFVEDDNIGLLYGSSRVGYEIKIVSAGSDRSENLGLISSDRFLASFAHRPGRVAGITQGEAGVCIRVIDYEIVR